MDKLEMNDETPDLKMTPRILCVKMTLPPSKVCLFDEYLHLLVRIQGKI